MKYVPSNNWHSYTFYILRQFYTAGRCKTYTQKNAKWSEHSSKEFQLIRAKFARPLEKWKVLGPDIDTLLQKELIGLSVIYRESCKPAVLLPWVTDNSDTCMSYFGLFFDLLFLGANVLLGFGMVPQVVL